MADRRRRTRRGSDRAAAARAARQRTVVLLGHEWHGVPEAQVEAADACVEIPMAGTGASLNVAVAGSLVLYRLAGMA
jgi:tRNA (guanosine-2'-O-)-methyltransferase